MFPTYDLNTILNTLNVQETSTTVEKSLAFDYSNKAFSLVDGSPLTNAGIEATKQWIILFFKTDKDSVPVYSGTNFGTSARKLIGLKSLNNGFYESEVEREVREGFLLCPSIKQVTSFNMKKVGRTLEISVTVQMQDGTTLDSTETITV